LLENKGRGTTERLNMEYGMRTDESHKVLAGTTYCRLHKLAINIINIMDKKG